MMHPVQSNRILPAYPPAQSGGKNQILSRRIREKYTTGSYSGFFTDSKNSMPGQDSPVCELPIEAQMK